MTRVVLAIDLDDAPPRPKVFDYKSISDYFDDYERWIRDVWDEINDNQEALHIVKVEDI